MSIADDHFAHANDHAAGLFGDDVTVKGIRDTSFTVARLHAGVD